MGSTSNNKIFKYFIGYCFLRKTTAQYSTIQALSDGVKNRKDEFQNLADRVVLLYSLKIMNITVKSKMIEMQVDKILLVSILIKFILSLCSCTQNGLNLFLLTAYIYWRKKKIDVKSFHCDIIVTVLELYLF